MRRRISAGVLLLALAGCAGPEPATSPVPTVSSDPTDSLSTASPVASTPPGLPIGDALAVRLIGDGPVIRGDVDGPEGYPNGNPGALVRDPDGMFHLYVASFGALPGDEVVTHSSSTDAVEWTVGTEPVYEDLGLELRNPGPVPTEALLVDDAWVLYGWGASSGARRADSSWRATAPAPTGPWTSTPGFALEPGPSGAWDAGAAVLNSVVATPDGFLLWYEGYPEGPGAESIGLATSADGISFTKDADPVIPAGACGTAPDAKAFQPNVLTTNEGYLMVFGGQEEVDLPTRIFAATSADGRSWTCAGDGPLPGLERFSGSTWVHSLQAFERDGQPAALFEVLAGDHTELWLGEIVPG
jgi:hypothetical protein